MAASRSNAPLALDLFGLCVAAVSTVYLLSHSSQNLRAIQAGADWSASAVAACLAAMVAYALAHTLRAIRLWLIIGTDRLSFSSTFGCHVSIALLTFATPFKLGDLLRATEFSRMLGNDTRGVFAVWLDRLFDVTVILVMLAVLVTLRPAGPSADVVFASLGAFLLCSILLGMLLPGAVAAFVRALLQSRSNRSLRVLRGMQQVRAVLSRIPTLDVQTFSLLCIVTFAVWGLELAMLFLLLIAFPAAGYTAPQQAIDILGSAIIARPGNHLLQLALYRSACLLTLAVMAALGVRSYAARRLRPPPVRAAAARYRYTPLFQAAKAAVKGRTR